jgi:hypothetical protein
MTETTFTAEQLKELLGLIKESDSVELKFTVPASHQTATLRGLDLDPLEAQIRQVFFLETPDLALDKLGVVVRARRIQGKGDDSVEAAAGRARVLPGPAPSAAFRSRSMRPRRVRLLGDDEGTLTAGDAARSMASGRCGSSSRRSSARSTSRRIDLDGSALPARSSSWLRPRLRS